MTFRQPLRAQRVGIFGSARLAWLLGAFIVIGTAAPGCKLEIEQHEVEAPKRPPGVPKKSIWVGGADGGVFIIVSPVGSTDPNAYSVEIYNDHSGSRLHHGRLRMDPEQSGSFPVGEAASYSGWDGETLHLRDGRRLVTPSPRR